MNEIATNNRQMGLISYMIDQCSTEGEAEALVQDLHAQQYILAMTRTYVRCEDGMLSKAYSITLNDHKNLLDYEL